jgi:hypothetical protein
MRTLVTACFLLIPFTLVGPITGSNASRRTNNQSKEIETAAKKAWPEYFAEFRAAVNKSDKVKLRKLMSDEFNGPPHTPEDAFKQWDDPKIKGWTRFRNVLTQGAVAAGKPDEGDPANLRPTMISPPAAEKQKGYRGWWAAFEFKEDGKWYCIQFLSMSEFSR